MPPAHVSQVRFADFFTDRDHNAFPADHRSQPSAKATTTLTQIGMYLVINIEIALAFLEGSNVILTCNQRLAILVLRLENFSNAFVEEINIVAKGRATIMRERGEVGHRRKCITHGLGFKSNRSKSFVGRLGSSWA